MDLRIILGNNYDGGSKALLFKTHPPPDVRWEKLAAKMGSSFDQITALTLANRLYRLKPTENNQVVGLNRTLVLTSYAEEVGDGKTQDTHSSYCG